MAIRYIIVVHGIGEQRKNETVLDVINRFAETRGRPRNEELNSILTLGRATGQTGRDVRMFPCRYSVSKHNFTPWMEFEGIPQTPDPNRPPQDFIGQNSFDGNNLRFVDLCWADLMQEDWPDVGEAVDKWAGGLLGRLKKYRNSHPLYRDENGKQRPLPAWILKALGNLAETLIWVRRVMSFRFKKFEDLIFNQFLGDVQLYGEFPRIRGKAVRRFHRLMRIIERHHWDIEQEKKKSNPDYVPQEPRYTVIAHSLGTVMSFDALLYAHIDRNLRKSEANRTDVDFPFPGYLTLSAAEVEKLTTTYETLHARELASPSSLTPDEKLELEKAEDAVGFLYTDWIERIDSFVTLGSPIDKYLVMWWLNYEYVSKFKGRIDPSLPGIERIAGTEPAQFERTRKISHYNYCDEQDPVGHELDMARSTEAYQAVFDNKEDRVFNRYPLPGVAHVDYWNDQDLFRRISDYAVDRPQETPPSKGFKWFDPETYKDILRIHYKFIPWFVVILDYLIFTWVLYSDSLHQTILAAFVTLGVWYLGRKIIDLMISWRQILRNKFRMYSESDPEKAEAEYPEKSTMGLKFRIWISIIPFFNAMLAALGLSVVADQVLHPPQAETDPFVIEPFLRQIYLFLGTMGALGALYWWLSLKKPVDLEESKVIGKESFWRANIWVVLLWGIMLFFSWIDTHLGWGHSIRDLLQSVFNSFESLEIHWLPHLWINLTVFLVVATTVFGYQAVRFWLTKKDLKEG